MDLIDFDRADDRLMAQVWQVRDRIEVDSRLEPYRQSLAEFATQWRYTYPGERECSVLATVEGAVVGYAVLTLPERDNLDLSFVDVRVEPAYRGRGIGSALLTWAEERAGVEGRSLLVSEAVVPVGEREEHPTRAFATRRGYSLASVEVVRRVRLPVPEWRLHEFEESARAAHGEQYDVSVHVNGVPEQLRESLCAAMNRLGVDAPTGDIDYEAESMTPADYQDYLDHEADLGWSRLTAVAVDRASGVVAAYTDLVLPTSDPGFVFQWGTLVLPEHRGNRLGLAVKVANLRTLGRVDPGRKAIRTCNDEQNPWMVRINEDLGFERIEEVLELKKQL
jgi:GNAT superfamily N-acetyltransferase